MKRTLWIALLALCTMALAVACAPISPDTPFDDGHAGSATSSFDIEGTGWLLTQYAQDGALVDVPTEVAITTDIGTDQTMTIYACNTMRATFVADGTMLTIQGGPTTLMACEGPLGEIESIVFATLPDVRSHEVADGVLTMSDVDGNPLLVWVLGVPAEAAEGDSLDGTAWILTDYSADGAVIAVPEEITVTGAFANGEFSGQACNNYSVAYTANGSSLTFGMVISTMMFCEGPLGEIESALFASFENVTNYTIEEGILKFLDDNGNLLAAFRDDDSTAADPAHDQVITVLSGTNWQVTGYLSDGALVAPDASVTATLDFGDDGAYSGQVCNGYRGVYTVDGNVIAFGPAVMTMMACVGPVGEFEPVFHSLLETATTFEMVGDELSLINNAGEVVLQFAAYAPPTLEGTLWAAVGINNGRGGVQSLAEGTAATATFADGTVSGNSGCNTFTAAYTLDGANLTIGPAASTMMMCADPEGLMEQETNFLNGLANVATWEIHNGVLTLRDADGATQITFLP